MEGPNFLVINPEECIDCSICVGQCPVNAIISADEASEIQKPFISLNAELAVHPDWHRITRKKSPLADHEQYKAVTNKLDLLIR